MPRTPGKTSDTKRRRRTAKPSATRSTTAKRAAPEAGRKQTIRAATGQAAAPAAKPSGDRNLSSVLGSRAMKRGVVAALASAAAALLYRRAKRAGQESDQETGSGGIEAPEEARAEPKARTRRIMTRRTAPEIGASTTDLGVPGDARVSKRKKRRDAGVKRGPRKGPTAASISMGTPPDGQTSVRSNLVTADSSNLSEADAQSALEVEAHPS